MRPVPILYEYIYEGGTPQVNQEGAICPLAKWLWPARYGEFNFLHIIENTPNSFYIFANYFKLLSKHASAR